VLLKYKASTLVVDDDCDLRFALVAMLEAQGHRVVEAEHGRDALDQLAKAAPHLIILDLTMPVMDGRTFLEEKAKGRHAAIPVIVFSSTAHPGVESMAGVVGVVHKLAGVEALLAAIERAAVTSTAPVQVASAASTNTREDDERLRSLRDASRAMGGGLKLELTPVDLGQLAAEVVLQRGPKPGAVERPPEVFVDGAVVVEGDRFHLQQMVSNLVTNAVNFGDGKPVRISVTSAQGKARLEVRDQGLGIDPDDQERVFQRFERAASSCNVKGLGLGLYIVREIVHAHGGTISVESALGKGSTFTASMPLHGSQSDHGARNFERHDS
jgi:signal transduction histidine kinase